MMNRLKYNYEEREYFVKLLHFPLKKIVGCVYTKKIVKYDLKD